MNQPARRARCLHSTTPQVDHSKEARNMPHTLLWLKTKLLDEGGIEEIFSHLRNLLIATVIIAAGSYVMRQPGVELFGVLNPGIAGVGVGTIGILLVVLNLIDGLYKLTRLGSPLAL